MCYVSKPSARLDVSKTRPPLGLRPRHIADAMRLQEIAEAIGRYIEANKGIPLEWIDEYNEIAGRLSRQRNKS